MLGFLRGWAQHCDVIRWHLEVLSLYAASAISKLEKISKFCIGHVEIFQTWPSM
jgi:hypothetical protein